jgi:enoyl-CoA hydratase/carnithine racemase
MTTDGSGLITSMDGPVLRVTLDRPDKLNALDLALLDALSRLADELPGRPEVRTVVLNGSGRGFCAGADLAYVDSIRADPQRVRGYLIALRDALTGLERVPQPVIAQLHGFVLAGGLELMLACDLSVAAASTRIGDQHMAWSFIPGGGSTQRLPRAVGAVRARDLLLTGRRLGADEAQAIGLISRIVPDEQLEAAVGELALELAGHGRHALAKTKALARLADETALAAGLQAEIDEVAAYYPHPDFAEGLRAFKSRTPPRFQ